MKNSVTALKQDIGTEFLPVKKTLSLAVIDLMNGVRKDMPQLQTLAGTLADLLSVGVSKLGDALQAALPYVQKALDYVANNGPQVAGILGGLAGTFAAMKFAPLAGNILEGAGSLLFGESGGLGTAAGGSKRKRRPAGRGGQSVHRRTEVCGQCRWHDQQCGRGRRRWRDNGKLQHDTDAVGCRYQQRERQLFAAVGEQRHWRLLWH